MTHTQLLKNHGAHSDFIAFASGYDDLAATIAASNDISFLRWSLHLIADPRKRVGITAHIVRHTPIGDGRTVYNLLTDDRSRHALDVCDAYAAGEATEEDLEAARAATSYAVTTVNHNTAASYAASYCYYAAAVAIYYAASSAGYADDAPFAASYAFTASSAVTHAATIDPAATLAWQADYIHSLDWATLTEALA